MNERKWITDALRVIKSVCKEHLRKEGGKDAEYCGDCPLLDVNRPGMMNRCRVSHEGDEPSKWIIKNVDEAWRAFKG